jgi:UDP-N-acetylmuramyl tripeptide synthase
MLKPGARAAVNRDDPGGPGSPASWSTRSPSASARVTGTRSTWPRRAGHPGHLRDAARRARLRVPLLGHFNLLNLLAAVAAAECLELPHDAVAEGIARNQRPLIGRMEPVDRGQPFPVFVDYSHTDQALTAALASLRQLSDRG